ncbi:MAG: hypothetical protein HQM12_04515 [SAR324 cluster bacterium]|nr:hypothetical protein [SAR324 cluster bacterium]
MFVQIFQNRCAKRYNGQSLRITDIRGSLKSGLHNFYGTLNVRLKLADFIGMRWMFLEVSESGPQFPAIQKHGFFNAGIDFVEHGPQ